MSCFEDEVDEPLWALNFKDYDTAELTNLIDYVQQARSWLVANGLSTSTEDIVGFRVGMPIVTGTDTLETTELYTATGDLDQLVKSISLDAAKISSKVTVDGVQYSQPYTFKSSFQHAIFSNYFFEGIENNTGYTYLDEHRMNLSDKAGLQVQYEGSLAKLKEPLPLPASIYGALVYIIQNATLVSSKEDYQVPKKGDIIYYTAAGFYAHLGTILTNATDVASRVATPYQEDIHELMVYLGMDQAFRDIQFGGSFNDMRIAMRIPTSRQNQLTLEGLLSSTENFDDIFKVKLFTLNNIDVDNNEKVEDLKDPYSNDKMDYPELDDRADGYGCYGTFYYNSLTQQYYTTAEECSAATEAYFGEGYDPIIHLPGIYCSAKTRYRYWYVSEEWMKSLTIEQLTIIFWMGLDIVTEKGDICPFDKILAIIIVVVMTYFTAGLGSGTALTVAQGLTVVAGIIQIASIAGVIDAKTASILSVALAVVSFGTSAASAATSTMSVLKQVIAIANQVLETVQIIDQEKFTEEAEELHDQIEKLTEDAELWESEFRFTYGDSYSSGVRNGPEADPYKYLKDTYKPFTIYTTSGFQ